MPLPTRSRPKPIPSRLSSKTWRSATDPQLWPRAKSRRKRPGNSQTWRTPEQAEIRGLLQRVDRIADYLSPALGGVGLTGVPAELNAALEVPSVGSDGSIQIPWIALLGTEQRALDGRPEQRAFTTAGTNNDGSEVQRPILQRLFGMDVAMNLGVSVSEVPVGRHEIPVLTAGVVPAQVKEPDAAAAAVPATFAFTTHKPKRISAGNMSFQP